MSMFGVVGSRKFKNRKLVEELIDRLPSKSVVVSGGCKGVDTWAVDHAKQTKRHGTIIFNPKKKNREGYFKRNLQIVRNSDMVFAFIPEGQMRSGAWNTINWCRKNKIPYVVFNEIGMPWDRRWKK